MPGVGAERQRLGPAHGGERQFPVEMREQPPVARRLPAQPRAERRVFHRNQDQPCFAGSVAPRIARLHQRIAACSAPPVLVGSSMGAFVSGLASLELPVAGLFLLATPALIPGSDFTLDVRLDVPTVLIHGWQDDVCPLDDIYEFAGRRQLSLLVVDDDHRLAAHVDAIGRQFGLFLEQLAKNA